MGTYAELVASSAEFNRLLDNIHQQDDDVHDGHRQPSSRRMTVVEGGIDEDLSLLPDDLESKREGSVDWRVYVSYLRAGAGLIVGVVLVTLIFGLRETASIFSSYWIAKWSDEESYRHRTFSNCTELVDSTLHRLKSLSEIEWNQHRNDRFYAYCGKGRPRECSLDPFASPGIIVTVLILTLLRIVAGKALCLNAGRVLHDKYVGAHAKRHLARLCSLA
jgi:hypothetical protein